MGATRVAFAKCDSKSEIEFFFERAELRAALMQRHRRLLSAGVGRKID